MKKLLLHATLAMMTLPLSAASLTPGELPFSFFSRILNGDFSMNFIDGRVYSDFETDGFAAYSYIDGSNVHFLLDYDVSAGSYWGNSFGGSTALGGSVFLAVALNYDLDVDGHEIDIYFDQLDPDVSSAFFFSGLPYTTVLMDAAAIAAGQGVYTASGDPDYMQSGTMSFGGLFSDNHPFICIECSFLFELNLVYLDFSTGFINFNPDDPRASLLFGRDSYDTTPYGWALGVNVQNVPIPGGLLLFASAMLGLGMTRSSAR
ncbi:MAG: hypothetical protein HKN70_06380 [Gammaproteobacteria bacterium]|nr:hypothetical protein [Gammaproteobacteria bacterium]